MKQWLTASMLLLSGCDIGDIFKVIEGCQSDSECDSESVCRIRYCVSLQKNPLVFQAQIKPPQGSGFVSQQLTHISVPESHVLNISLIDSLNVSGVVRNQEALLSSNLPGQLEFRTSGDLSGTSFTQSISSRDGVDEHGYGFQVSLLPGRPYTVSFRPDHAQLPRHSVSFSAEELADGVANIELPAHTNYRKVSGRLLFPDYLPIGSARIIARTEARETLYISTSETIRGMYEVIVPPSARVIEFKVEATENSPAFADFVAGPFTLSEATETQVDLYAPTESKAPVTQVGCLIDMERRAVPGRVISFANSSSADTTYRRTVTSGPDGCFSLLLLEGSYEVLVSEPAQSELATLYISALEVPPQDDFLWLHMRKRERVSLEVKTHLGIPLQQAQVRLERQTTWREGQKLTLPSFNAELELKDGHLEAAVDEGRYDIRVIPDLSTSAPAFVIRNLDIRENTFHSLTLPPATLLRLNIQTSGQVPLANTTVELFVREPEGESCAECPQRSLLSIGTSDTEGNVDFLLPLSWPNPPK